MNTHDAASTAVLEHFARVLAPHLVREFVAQLGAGTGGLVDQVSSPLGRRRHCATVRRLVQTGASGAAVVGRRHLLSQERLDAELAAVSKRPKKVAAPKPVDELAELRGKYGLELVRSK